LHPPRPHPLLSHRASAPAQAKRLIPLLDRVLVKRMEAPKSIGGILLPEAAGTKLNEGMIISAGPGRRDKDGSVIPMGVKEGDKVLLPPYGGSEIKLGDEDYFIFRDEDILGVLKD
jgi:chaperonin GroES